MTPVRSIDFLNSNNFQLFIFTMIKIKSILVLETEKKKKKIGYAFGSIDFQVFIL